jgi:hypothetical protein
VHSGISLYRLHTRRLGGLPYTPLMYSRGVPATTVELPLARPWTRFAVIVTLNVGSGATLVCGWGAP